MDHYEIIIETNHSGQKLGNVWRKSDMNNILH